MICSERVMGEEASIDFHGDQMPPTLSLSLSSMWFNICTDTQPARHIFQVELDKGKCLPHSRGLQYWFSQSYWNHQIKTMNARCVFGMICLQVCDRLGVTSGGSVLDKVARCRLTRGSVYNCTHRLGALHSVKGGGNWRRCQRNWKVRPRDGIFHLNADYYRSLSHRRKRRWGC